VLGVNSIVRWKDNKQINRFIAESHQSMGFECDVGYCFKRMVRLDKTFSLYVFLTVFPFYTNSTSPLGKTPFPRAQSKEAGLFQIHFSFISNKIRAVLSSNLNEVKEQAM
jgi:hypothetical protein